MAKEYDLIQGVSKKRYFSDFRLISVLEVRFYFFTCVLESEFGARFIKPLKKYPFRILSENIHGRSFQIHHKDHTAQASLHKAGINIMSAHAFLAFLGQLRF